jgi:hypothetical protein
MYRPWHEDDRPVWRVEAGYALPGPLTRDNAKALGKMLAATGMARSPSIRSGTHWALVAVFVRGSDGTHARLAAEGVVRAGDREAGLGLLTAPPLLTRVAPVRPRGTAPSTGADAAPPG